MPQRLNRLQVDHIENQYNAQTFQVSKNYTHNESHMKETIMQI